jgi:hypothetical protein
MPLPIPSRLWPVVLAACAACGAAPQPPAAQNEPARPDSAQIAASQPLTPAPARADSARQEIRSVRTTLKAEECTTVSVDEEAGGSTQRCPGTAGYTLMALDGDARASITVITPAGTEQPLEFWTSVTGGFSSLGEAAEWRVRGEGASAVPVALIVELRANEHPDDTERLTIYRVVAKLTPAETCVTHKLSRETPDAEVRRLADAAASQPCVSGYSEQ